MSEKLYYDRCSYESKYVDKQESNRNSWSNVCSDASKIGVVESGERETLCYEKSFDGTPVLIGAGTATVFSKLYEWGSRHFGYKPTVSGYAFCATLGVAAGVVTHKCINR